SSSRAPTAAASVAASRENSSYLVLMCAWRSTAPGWHKMSIVAREWFIVTFREPEQTSALLSIIVGSTSLPERDPTYAHALAFAQYSRSATRRGSACGSDDYADHPCHIPNRAVSPLWPVLKPHP